MTPSDASETTQTTDASNGSGETLSNLMHEERRFEPPPELAANANVTDDDLRRG